MLGELLNQEDLNGDKSWVYFAELKPGRGRKPQRWLQSLSGREQSTQERPSSTLERPGFRQRIEHLGWKYGLDLRRREKYQYVALVVRAGRTIDLLFNA